MMEAQTAPIIDADAEELKRINAEITRVLATLHEMELEYAQAREPVSNQLHELLKQKQMLGPKPRCFAAQDDLGPVCDNCSFCAPCFRAMKARREASS